LGVLAPILTKKKTKKKIENYTFSIKKVNGMSTLSGLKENAIAL
jgi:hypothetical protein